MTKYISYERLTDLENAINFASDFKPRDYEVVVGESLNQVDNVKTELLRELGKINIRREEILN